MTNNLWRPSYTLRGKDLSAFTLAAFAVLQGSDPKTLSTHRTMPAGTLNGITRPKTVQYWRSNGWLEPADEAGMLRLSESGLRKVEDRLAGRAGAQSVDLALVEYWRQYILNGGEDAQAVS